MLQLIFFVNRYVILFVPCGIYTYRMGFIYKPLISCHKGY